MSGGKDLSRSSDSLNQMQFTNAAGLYQSDHQQQHQHHSLEEGNRRALSEGTKTAEDDEEKYKKQDNGRFAKLLFCFVGLQVSYVWWGFVQEHLMTGQYSMGKFKSSTFCVFSNRFLSLIISLVVVLFKRITSPVPLKEAPFLQYAPSSLSNSLSSWAQYEALKYISFPTQVLSKSCKVIPVMLVGMIINRKSYPLMEYLEAAMITIGVAAFNLSEKKAKAGASEVDSSYGIMLLALYLLCDSFTSQWQSRVFKQYKVDQFQMMLGVNIWSLLMTGFTLYQSGELFTSFAFVLADSTVLMHVTILSITSATGQLFIYYTIKEFGPVIFTTMMATRQILSLLLSLLYFGHGIGIIGWISSLTVFAVVFSRIYRSGN